MANLRTGEFDYGEVPPHEVLQLLPECLVEFLLDSEFELRYHNGAPGNSYDSKENRAEIKKTDDMLHEIGHGLWYNKIPQHESYEKVAVMRSLIADGGERIKLEPKQIPTMHRDYAALVGAYSGQFLLDSYPNQRMNDLEEHFARNFDYLLKGKPLEALGNSDATLTQFLQFYRHIGIIDFFFEHFYRLSIQEDHKGRWLHKVRVREMKDGDSITSGLIKRVAELKKIVTG
jgi:hypothetical protein